MAAKAEELDLPAAAPAPPPPREEDLGPYPTLARMVTRVVDGRPEGERFGPRSVVEEVNRRFRKLLRRSVEPSDVSVVLRRMHAAGRILLGPDRTAYERYGKGHHSAALNLGDCCSYALSRFSGEALLFKGNDFSRTDVVVAEGSSSSA